MTLVHPFALVPQGVAFNAADAGASAAGGNAAGSTGAPTGGGGGQAASTGGGGGTGSAVSITDDTPVTIGGKTYGSFKEYQSGFAPRSEVDAARQLTRQELETNLRNLATQLQRQGKLPNGQPKPGGQRVDPFAGVRDLAFVDGKTLEQLYNQGLGPIAQAIQQLQQHVAKQNQTIQRLQGVAAPLAERHSTQEFQQRISNGIQSALAGVDAKDPFVSELAQDVFHSYEWAKGKEDAEFTKYLGDRYKAAEAHFKAKFRKELDDAKTKKWQRPGGNATPSGAPVNPLSRATPQQIARNVFAGQQTGT